MLHYAVMATTHYWEVGEAGIRNFNSLLWEWVLGKLDFFVALVPLSFAALQYVHPICNIYNAGPL